MRDSLSGSDYACSATVATSVSNDSFGGVTYHVEGELVPVLHIELGSISVYFEHHVLLWKDPQVTVEIKALSGGFKRMMAGLPIFLTETRGHGHISFSRDGAGHILAKHLRQGEALDVREHQFLAATDQVEYSFSRVKGVSNMLLGGTGFFIDKFHCTRMKGVVWLHGYGNVFQVTLGPGQSIDIEPGGWIYKDTIVQMNTQFQRLSTGLLASAGQLVWNRFTGPGRVGIQSMYLHYPTAK